MANQNNKKNTKFEQRDVTILLFFVTLTFISAAILSIVLNSVLVFFSVILVTGLSFALYSLKNPPSDTEYIEPKPKKRDKWHTIHGRREINAKNTDDYKINKIKGKKNLRLPLLK